jgi:signal peptidase II
MWRLLWIAAVVFVCDQLTKFSAAGYLIRHGDIQLTAFLNFALVHNKGAAFGFLSSASGWQNIFFIAVASVACLAILWMTWRLTTNDRVLGTGLMLILGGAAGNLTDRLLHGYVSDFVDVYYRSWHWPAFNVADSAITVGAVLLALDALGWYPWKKQRMP